jgi:hypothetical protein
MSSDGLVSVVEGLSEELEEGVGEVLHPTIEGELRVVGREEGGGEADGGGNSDEAFEGRSRRTDETSNYISLLLRSSAKVRDVWTYDSVISASANPAARLSTTEMFGSICFTRDRSIVVSSKPLQMSSCSSEARSQVDGKRRKGSVRRLVRSVRVMEGGRMESMAKLWRVSSSGSGTCEDGTLSARPCFG